MALGQTTYRLRFSATCVIRRGWWACVGAYPLSHQLFCRSAPASRCRNAKGPADATHRGSLCAPLLLPRRSCRIARVNGWSWNCGIGLQFLERLEDPCENRSSFAAGCKAKRVTLFKELPQHGGEISDGVQS